MCPLNRKECLCCLWSVCCGWECLSCEWRGMGVACCQILMCVLSVPEYCICASLMDNDVCTFWMERNKSISLFGMSQLSYGSRTLSFSCHHNTVYGSAHFINTPLLNHKTRGQGRQMTTHDLRYITLSTRPRKTYVGELIMSLSLTGAVVSFLYWISPRPQHLAPHRCQMVTLTLLCLPIFD